MESILRPWGLLWNLRFKVDQSAQGYTDGKDNLAAREELIDDALPSSRVVAMNRSLNDIHQIWF